MHAAELKLMSAFVIIEALVTCKHSKALRLLAGASASSAFAASRQELAAFASKVGLSADVLGCYAPVRCFNMFKCDEKRADSTN